MYRYRLYGLNISSSRRITLLEEVVFSHVDLQVDWQISSSETPDNTLDWKSVETEFLDKLDYLSLSEAADGKFTKVSFRESGDEKPLNFVLDSEKTRLWVYHHEDDPESDLDSYFVGPVLGFTMRLREIVCLHSSVIGINGKAVLFLGCSTAGKSTTAAGMADTGADILADDMAVLNRVDGVVMVQSGYSKVRLRPKAAEFLTADPESLPIVYSTRESRYFCLENENKFYSEALPLAAIYVLGEVSDDYLEPFIRPVEPRDRLIDLLKNTSGSYVVRGNLRAKEFEVLGRIAKNTPMRRLYYAHDITTLPRQCQIILEDLKEIL